MIALWIILLVLYILQKSCSICLHPGTGIVH